MKHETGIRENCPQLNWVPRRKFRAALAKFILHCVRLGGVLKIRMSRCSDVQRALRLGHALLLDGIPVDKTVAMLLYDILLRDPHVSPMFFEHRRNSIESPAGRALEMCATASLYWSVYSRQQATTAAKSFQPGHCHGDSKRLQPASIEELQPCFCAEPAEEIRRGWCVLIGPHFFYSLAILSDHAQPPAPASRRWVRSCLYWRRLLLRGRRSIWNTSVSFCVAGAALGASQSHFAWQVQRSASHCHFAWQVQHLLSLILRGRCSTRRTAREVRGSPATIAYYGRWLLLRGRRSICNTSVSFCVAGAALGVAALKKSLVDGKVKGARTLTGRDLALIVCESGLLWDCGANWRTGGGRLEGSPCKRGDADGVGSHGPCRGCSSRRPHKRLPTRQGDWGSERSLCEAGEPPEVVHRGFCPRTACTFSTSERQKVVRTCNFFTLLTWKCASGHNGVHFSRSQLPKVVRGWSVLYILTWKCFAPQRRALFDISTSKSAPKLRCFSHFHVEMCFGNGMFCAFWLGNVLRTTPACTFRHLNFQKAPKLTSKSAPKLRCFSHFDVEMCFGNGMFCTFWLGNVLRATTVYTFSRSQLAKAVPEWYVLYILTWKCASRHNGVHFFDIPTCSEAEVLCTFWLRNVLRATTACNLSSLIWPDGSTPAALASLLFEPPEPQSIGKHNESRLSYLFAYLHLLSSLFLFSDLLTSFLLLSDSPHLCFSVSPYCRKFDF